VDVVVGEQRFANAARVLRCLGHGVAHDHGAGLPPGGLVWR
jgi:hypothetical protein